MRGFDQQNGPVIHRLRMHCLRNGAGIVAACALLVIASGCFDRKRHTAGAAAPPPAESAPGGARPTTVDSSDAGAADSLASNREEPAPGRASLPPDVVPGKPVVVEVPGDRPIHLVHGEATTRHAFIYLHGVCGDVTAMYSWAKMASRYGTLIALLGDQECDDVPGRFRWSLYTAGIDERVDRALEVAEKQRQGQLDTDELTVIGYSQGATRAAMLTQRFAEKYPRAIIAGTPSKPRVTRVGLAGAIAVVGGERETTAHMVRGVENLSRAGKRAKFFLLPEAAHGQYGPEGARVMEEAIRFVLHSGD